MYRRIMIVVDDDAVARAAIREGLDVARVHRAQVLFFHVLPNYVIPLAEEASPLVYLSPEQHKREVEHQAGRVLAAAGAQARKKGVVSSSALGSGLDTADCIARAASARKCDLIVIGSHGRSALQRLVFGSVVVSLIPIAPVPLLVCKATAARSKRDGPTLPIPRKARRARAPATRAA